MRFLKEIVTAQIEINKSIFIGILFPLSVPNDIQDKILEAKSMFPKANHYCSASIYGEQKEHATAHDDGEPQRTAGIPILEVLKHHDFTNILCVVVRYFGGIKLGAGGLVRAYTKAAALVVSEAKFYQKVIVPSYEVIFGYKMIQTIDYLLEDKAEIIEKTFLDQVTYIIVLNQNVLNPLKEISHQLILYQQLEDRIIYLDASTDT